MVALEWLVDNGIVMDEDRVAECNPAGHQTAAPGARPSLRGVPVLPNASSAEELYEAIAPSR